MAALFFWVVLGGLIGGAAKSTFWYERSHGWLPTLLFGAVGGIAGGYLRQLAGASDGFDLSSMGLIALGAVAALSVYSLISQRRHAVEIPGQRRAA